MNPRNERNNLYPREQHKWNECEIMQTMDLIRIFEMNIKKLKNKTLEYISYSLGGYLKVHERWKVEKNLDQTPNEGTTLSK